MPSPNDAANRTQGFEGAMAGLSLPDVIQLNGSNRFSGCIAVQYGAKTGLVFFRDGEIVHAEQDGHSGEDAFYDIVEWQSGRFTLQPNVASTSRTIQKNVQHLLMEAHRVMDERRAGRDVAAPPQAPQDEGGAKASTARATLDRLRRVPGVAYAVVIGKDGTCVEDASFEAQTLGGQTAYAAIVADRLGAVFRAGAAQSVVIHGSTQHLILLATKNHFVGVAVKSEAEVGAVEPEIRRALGAR